ncbi:hypothetical protein HPB50_014646 [Hyalomma asiaticum]|uniref:Uncharacterized protein n=1 Tax=Hyalomma asiaticum TaxID=266040 RepID=A0ACB7SCP9_HYAAI|nr:hypothetical protein HPB50_014646 [Hyalomma asiaticum]
METATATGSIDQQRQEQEANGPPESGIKAYFSTLAKHHFAAWEELELELHVSGPYVPGNCFIEVCTADSMKQATLIPFDKWVQQTVPDAFNIFVSQDHRLKPESPYVARFLHEGIAIAASETFSFFEGDNTDELFVMSEKELRELTIYRKQLRGYQAKLSQAENELREERRERSKEREVNQLNEALVWELKQGIAAKNAEYMKALNEMEKKHRQEMEVRETVLSSTRKQLDTTARKLSALRAEHDALMEETAKSLSTIKAEHDALKVDYKLQQEALENVREQLSAQESTKALLHSEIKTLQESRAQFALRVVNVMTENEGLKETIQKLSRKPAMSDSGVNTEDEEGHDNEVNNNSVITTSAAKELANQLREMVARLKAAADESTKLYRKYKKQEVMMERCHCATTTNDKRTAQFSASNPQIAPARVSGAVPKEFSTRKVSVSVPSIAELKETEIARFPTLVDLSCSLPGVSNPTCQECPPTTVGATSNARTASFADSSHHATAWPKVPKSTSVIWDIQNGEVVYPACTKSRKVTAPTWKKTTRMSPLSRSSRLATQSNRHGGWNMPCGSQLCTLQPYGLPPYGFGGPPSYGFGAPPPSLSCREPCVQDASAQTDGTTTADSAAQVEATVPEISGRSEEEATVDLDSAYVAIEMPEGNSESTQTTNTEPATETCVLCTEEVFDLEEHLRAVHKQQPCPVCNCLFETTLPSTYIENHIEDHFAAPLSFE